MARSFSSKDATGLIKYHEWLLSQLQTVEYKANEQEQRVSKAAERIVAAETLKILRNVPIEEINRDKHGFRIKNLKEHGYNTIADIAAASVYSIASVRGVSQDSAYTIRRIADDLINKARRDAKIKISEDNKSPEYTALVKAISDLQKSRQYIYEGRKLLRENSGYVKKAIEYLKPGRNGFAWFFASKAKKTSAEGAFRYLAGLAESGFGQAIDRCTGGIYAVEQELPERAWEYFSREPVSFFNTLETVSPGVLGNDDAVYGLPEELAREIQDECFFPDGLLCELRRYQEWGVKYILHQGKVLLGDEMGLGKTIQAIAAMVSLKNTGATHFVVVCPASVLSNWCREIPNRSKLRVIKVHGSGRNGALKAWISNGGVAVTTYETTAYFKFEDRFRFSMLVVDEAHYIKNTQANRSQHVRELCERAERLLFMTGTALENRVDEMISLIQVLNPYVADNVQKVAFMAAAPKFREKVAPVYYRRKREDVLTELPELTVSEEWCSLGAEEECVYEQTILTKNYMAARRVSWNVNDLNNSSKAKRMMELIEEAASDGRKVIVFSFFLDTIHKVCSLLGNRCVNPLNGSVTPQRRQEIIDEFDKAPAGTVLAAQIQSGGTGLNIQSASVVILCEPQFKPSIENQAISRAYRMGQTRNVLVYRLLCENTIEEKVMQTLAAKQAEFDAFADKSVAAQDSLELDQKSFGNIIEEEIERIKNKKVLETQV